MSLVVRLLPAAAIVVAAANGCSKGQTLRGTTSVGTRAALAANHVDYKGSIACSGNALPITCRGTSTSGEPIAATLDHGDGSSCVLVVTVGGRQIERQSGARCR